MIIRCNRGNNQPKRRNLVAEPELAVVEAFDTNSNPAMTLML
jgi:hypothetical protein